MDASTLSPVAVVGGRWLNTTTMERNDGRASRALVRARQRSVADLPL